jgi:ribosomal protein S18 acetylase RimI-like enzyme
MLECMELRPLRASDLNLLGDIDAVIESNDYLHVERSGDGLSVSLSVEPRPLRQKLLGSNPISDDLAMIYRQIASGADEGIGIVADHDGQLLAAAVAQPRHEFKTMQLIDLRVDFDHRRQGMATAMLYQIINAAREAEMRAVFAEVRSNQFPANQMMQKLGFELAGVDVRRNTNHDLVKEAATLLWYAAFD